MTRPSPRRLHSGHFAFMRALAQGLDQRASWDRYLRLEGEHSDVRTVRRTIAWIRDAFAAAARREQRPGTARLILLDPERFPNATPLPSLAEFAEAQGMEDFSEAEQLEAYAQAYPTDGRAGRGKGSRSTASATPSRRARVIERQLDALRWLEGLVARDPRPGDSVAAWLNPAMAARLELAGLSTLFSLVERINGIGARWWVHVPGVGEVKATRILDWLAANEEVLGGLRVGRHVALPRSQLSPSLLAGVVPPSTALVPLEKFVPPAALDGRAGRYRAAAEHCTLDAGDDRAAIGVWLAAKQGGRQATPARPTDRAATPSSTQRAYRKEAERLLLWAVLERRKALSSLDAQDAVAYAGFLQAPPGSWCGPRHHQRWSPLWRPLEGPLGAPALRQALAIARSFFAFLQAHGYVVANPFGAGFLAVTAPRPVEPERTLTYEQWIRVSSRLESHPDTAAGRRLRRGMRWLRATGLQLAELTDATCGDLARASFLPDGDSLGDDWFLSVRGRGGRVRNLRVPAELVAELGEELARHGLDRQVDAASNRGVHLMARFDPASGRALSWSPSGLHQAIKAFFAQAAEALDGPDAEHLRNASARWLRPPKRAEASLHRT